MSCAHTGRMCPSERRERTASTRREPLRQPSRLLRRLRPAHPAAPRMESPRRRASATSLRPACGVAARPAGPARRAIRSAAASVSDRPRGRQAKSAGSGCCQAPSSAGRRQPVCRWRGSGRQRWRPPRPRWRQSRVAPSAPDRRRTRRSASAANPALRSRSRRRRTRTRGTRDRDRSRQLPPGIKVRMSLMDMQCSSASSALWFSRISRAVRVIAG